MKSVLVAVRAIKEDFYVNDLLTGANSINAVSLANEISNTLKQAGFLRK